MPNSLKKLSDETLDLHYEIQYNLLKFLKYSFVFHGHCVYLGGYKNNKSLEITALIVFLF